MRDSTIIYRSFYEAIKDLPKTNQAEIWNAIFEYSLNFKEIEISKLSKTIFTLIKPQLEANIKRYKNGLQPKTEQTISEDEANDKQTVSETKANKNDNVNQNKKVNKKENKNHNHNDSIYAGCIGLYNDFCLKRINVPAKMDGLQGKSMKEIIAYFNTLEKVKSGEQTPQTVLSFIFSHWDKLDEFLRAKIKLNEINSNLPNILSQIKTPKKNGQHQTTAADLAAAVERATTAFVNKQGK